MTGCATLPGHAPEFPALHHRPASRRLSRLLRAPGAQDAADGPYDQEHPKRWQAGKDYDLALPFYGFEHVDLCTAHGDHVGGHYYLWLKSQYPDADALRDRRNQLPHDYACPQAFRTPLPEELYPTAYIAG